MRRTRAGVEKENQALAASSTIVGVPRAKKSDTGGRRRAAAGADALLRAPTDGARVGNGVAGLARVWNNYSIPRVEISHGLYIYTC